MKRLFPSILTVLLGLTFVFPTSGFSSDWKNTLTGAVSEIVGGVDGVETLYVSAPRDSASDRRYYPFMDKSVHRILVNSAQREGITIVDSPLDASHYLETEFGVRAKGLSLFFRLKPSDGTKASTSKILELEDGLLPEDWSKRTLRDIAYELASKLESALFGQQYRLIVGEFSGGQAETSGLVSEFSQLVRDDVREELGKLDMFDILSQESSDSADSKVIGRFRASGTEIIFRVMIFRHDDKRELANVSSRFSPRIVPDSVQIFPENKVIAEPTVDKPSNTGVLEVEETSIEVLLGVNHENRIYQAGDPLVIYLRPNKDLYARVYYVQSDGSICQILPYGGSSGSLRGDRTYAIGDVGDDIEMIITDSTLGQETIKVFASLGQIDDSHLPHGFRAGQQLNCDVSDYGDLKERITRGLRLKYTVRPVAEVKILVTKRRE